MKKEVDLRLRIVGAVETDDVIVLVLDPDPALKARYLVSLARQNIDHEAAHIAKELTAHESEFVITLLEIRVDHDHLGKAHRQKVQRVDASEFGHHAMAESWLPYERDVVGPVSHVETAQEIFIFHRLCI